MVLGIRQSIQSVWRQICLFAAFIAEKSLKTQHLVPTTFDLLKVLHRTAITPEMTEYVRKTAKVSGVLHWKLKFSQVFVRGGFDVVIGNPPWDSLWFREEEFFAESRPEIANSSTAATRKRMIANLETSDSKLFSQYIKAVHYTAAVNAFVRSSGRFPLCGLGRVNLFALFAEAARSLVAKRGRIGQILPSGVVTDDSTKLFFQKIADSGQLISFFDFENREGIFEAIDRRIKFGLLTIAGSGDLQAKAEFVFFATNISHLKDSDRRFSLGAADIALLNPATRTCPIFRTKRDAELTKSIYRRVPVLTESGWQCGIRRFLNASDDSPKFQTDSGPNLLPLYEGKYFHLYDHRWVTFDGNDDRQVTDNERLDGRYSISPRFWYPSDDIQTRFGSVWEHPWVLACRDITNSTNERTFIASIIPSTAVSNTAKVVLVPSAHLSLLPCLQASFSSMVFDFVSRQKIGGMHMSGFIIEQLPVLGPEVYARPAQWDKSILLSDWIRNRVLELVFTSHEPILLCTCDEF